MKNLMLGIFLLGFVVSGYAQKVIRLDDVNLKANSEALKLDDNSSIIINVPEAYKGEFYENTLGFARNKFDIKEFVLVNEDQNFDSYDVTFKTTKGDLNVGYDKIGEMTSAQQSFKDVAMPHPLMMKLLRANEGYRIVGTRHIGISKGNWTFDKEYYKVKLKNGKKSKTVKINVDKSLSGRVAAN